MRVKSGLGILTLLKEGGQNLKFLHSRTKPRHDQHHYAFLTYLYDIIQHLTRVTQANPELNAGMCLAADYYKNCRTMRVTPKDAGLFSITQMRRSEPH
jgi:hypothetical protein